MNADDLVKAAPVLAKGAAALGASVPFTAVLKRMLGPAADEVAEMWRDQVRLYRYGRQLSCLQKAEKMAVEAGFQPSPVPSKILFPLLEGASYEEHEDMHTMWAALLANAANPSCSDWVRPGYIALLRQMAPDEAALLNWLYADAIRGRPANYCLTINWVVGDLRPIYRELISAKPKGADDFHGCLEALEGSFLIERFDAMVKRETAWKLKLTGRGVNLVAACTAPVSRRQHGDAGKGL